MFSIDLCFWLHTGWAPSLWLITCLLGGCRIIQITSNSTSTNTNAPNKRNKSESRTTCEREKWMISIQELREPALARVLATGSKSSVLVQRSQYPYLENLKVTCAHYLSLSQSCDLLSGSPCAQNSCAKRELCNLIHRVSHLPILSRSRSARGWETLGTRNYECFTFLIFLILVKIWWTRQVLENIAPNPTVNPSDSMQNRACMGNETTRRRLNGWGRKARRRVAVVGDCQTYSSRSKWTGEERQRLICFMTWRDTGIGRKSRMRSIKTASLNYREVRF